MIFFGATALAILVVMGLALVRAFAGPSIYDRVLAVNMVGTKTVLLICVLDSLGTPGQFLDVALVYTLINFIGVIAMLRFFEPVDMSSPREGGGL